MYSLSASSGESMRIEKGSRHGDHVNILSPYLRERMGDPSYDLVGKGTQRTLGGWVETQFEEWD